MNVREDGVAMVDKPLNGIGDFVFAARRWLYGVDGIEYVAVEHVDADKREVAGRVGGLFDQALDAAIGAHFGDAVGGWILDLFQDDLALPGVRGEIADERTDAAFNDIVAEKHHEGIRSQEVARNLDRMRKAVGAVLRDVGELDIPFRAVSQGSPDFRRGVADDDANLAHAGFANGLDDADEDGLVGDGYELLGAGIGERVESRALAAAEDQSLHSVSSLWA